MSDIRLSAKQISEIIGESVSNVNNWRIQGLLCKGHTKRVKLVGITSNNKFEYDLDVVMEYIKTIVKSKPYYNKLLKYWGTLPATYQEPDNKVLEFPKLELQDNYYENLAWVNEQSPLSITRSDAETNVKQSKEVYNKWLSEISLEILDASKRGLTGIEVSTQGLSALHINDAFELLTAIPYNFDVSRDSSSYFTISWE